MSRARSVLSRTSTSRPRCARRFRSAAAFSSMPSPSAVVSGTSVAIRRFRWGSSPTRSAMPHGRPTSSSSATGGSTSSSRRECSAARRSPSRASRRSRSWCRPCSLPTSAGRSSPTTARNGRALRCTSPPRSRVRSGYRSPSSTSCATGPPPTPRCSTRHAATCSRTGSSSAARR